MELGVVDGFTLLLPFERPPLLMNELRSKSHWHQQHKAHTMVKDTVMALCLHHHPDVSYPRVSVELTWHAKTLRRRDPDSLAPMVKGCLDGLVAAGVIPDDASTYVSDVRLRIQTGATDPRIELMVVKA